MMEAIAMSVQEMIADARQRVEGLTPAQVAAELEAAEVLLIDIRDEEERYQNGVLANAHHISRGMLEFRADPATPYHDVRLVPSRRIILHCASGGRSALAADTLARMGYGKVAHLEGGLKAWKEQGFAVEDLAGAS